MISQQAKQEFARILLDAFNAITELPQCAYAPMMAMAALESGWGATPQAQRGFNYWNLSAGSEEHGRSPQWPLIKPVIVGLDTEPDGKGGARAIHQYWRAYPTSQAGVEDYLAELCFPRYQPARDALMADNGEQFITLLGPDRTKENPPLGGWYTKSTAAYLLGYKACVSEVLAMLPEDLSQPQKYC